MRTLEHEPASAAGRATWRSASVRRVSGALTGFLLTLAVSSGAVAGPDQFASLEMPSFGTASESRDLDALEAKIRNTDAIDLFAKISIKNELSSLIEEIARSRESKNAADLKIQKARFEKLIDGTVAMLRKGDAPLAKEVAESRGAIWNFLNRPEIHVAAASLQGEGQFD